MHFGAERGMNSAERCEAVLVIGREQPSSTSSRTTPAGSRSPQMSLSSRCSTSKEEGELRLYRRRRRMRDGSEVWAEVRSHPDPFARALLEQMREAAIAQMADRVRAVWHERLTVIATSVPVDLDVTQLVTQGELMRAAGLAAAGKRGVDAQGWWLQPVEAAQRAREAELASAAEFCNRYPYYRKARCYPDSPPCCPPRRQACCATALWSRLPQAEAFRLAAAVHPGLRAPPPPAACCASACAGTGCSWRGLT